MAQFLDVRGEEASARQNLSVISTRPRREDTIGLRPGLLRLVLENRTDSRVLPAVWVANQALDDLLTRRKPILTAKRLLTDQTVPRSLPDRHARHRPAHQDPELTFEDPDGTRLEINHVPGKGLLSPGLQIGGGYADGTQNG